MQHQTLQVGSTEIDVFQQSDGSYRFDLETIARAINVKIPNLLQFLLQENAIETNITGELNGDRQERVVTPAGAIAILQWQSEQGNPKAQHLLRALCSVAIDEYLDRRFQEPLSEKDAMWQAYLVSERDREEVYRRLANS